MGVRLLSFVIWALVATSAAFWALRMGGRGLPVPAHAARPGTDAVTAAAADLTRLFGSPPVAAPVATPAPPPASSRFKLLGVVAARSGGSEGLALVSVDGQPARAYRVGARVEGDWALRGVGHRRAELAPQAGGPAIVLELPALAEAARGTPGSAQRPGLAPQNVPQAGGGAVLPPGSRVGPLRAPIATAPVAPTVAPPPNPAPPADERPSQPGVVSQ